VNSPTSGAYKAINGFFKERNLSLEKTTSNLSVTDAEKYFLDAVKWIQSNVTWNFTPSIAENIFCELNREKGIAQRNGVLHTKKIFCICTNTMGTHCTTCTDGNMINMENQFFRYY
jgi:hypothetical protein